MCCTTDVRRGSTTLCSTTRRQRDLVGDMHVVVQEVCHGFRLSGLHVRVRQQVHRFDSLQSDSHVRLELDDVLPGRTRMVRDGW